MTAIFNPLNGDFRTDRLDVMAFIECASPGLSYRWAKKMQKDTFRGYFLHFTPRKEAKELMQKWTTAEKELRKSTERPSPYMVLEKVKEMYDIDINETAFDTMFHHLDDQITQLVALKND